MGKAVRAIIVENGKALVMHRNKYGSKYFTLVGGRVNEGENLEQALVREIREETGISVTSARLVFTEAHTHPYNEQYIYLCEVAPHTSSIVQEASEEGQMNKYGMNVHQPTWVEVRSFGDLPFRTPLLQQAMVEGFKKGFPKQTKKLEEVRKQGLFQRIRKRFA